MKKSTSKCQLNRTSVAWSMSRLSCSRPSNHGVPRSKRNSYFANAHISFSASSASTNVAKRAMQSSGSSVYCHWERVFLLTTFADIACNDMPGVRVPNRKATSARPMFRTSWIRPHHPYSAAGHGHGESANQFRAKPVTLYFFDAPCNVLSPRRQFFFRNEQIPAARPQLFFITCKLLQRPWKWTWKRNFRVYQM